MPDGDHAALIRERRPGLATAGRVVDTAGNVLGEHDGFERRRRGVVRPLEFEQDRYRVALVDRERVAPTEVDERGVESGPGVHRGRVADAAGEERADVSIHYRSSPRSRSRRAMMLRWISEVPP